MPPYPQLWNQAQQFAQSQLQGYLQTAGRANRRETRRGQRYIRRLAHSFADELGQIAGGIGNSYDQYQQAMGATDAAISNYLGGQGQQQMGDLNAALSYSPQAQAHYAGQAANIGNALGKVAAGYTAQNQQQFLGEAASNTAFGKSLPGIAALSGIQSASDYQNMQSDRMAALRENVMSQLPSLTTNLYSSFASQASAAADRAQAARLQHQQMQGAGSDRLAQAQSDAADLMNATVNPPPGPIGSPPVQVPGYKDVHDRIASLFQQRFPGKSDAWVEQQTMGVLGQFGYTPWKWMQESAGTMQNAFTGGFFGPTQPLATGVVR